MTTHRVFLYHHPDMDPYMICIPPDFGDDLSLALQKLAYSEVVKLSKREIEEFLAVGYETPRDIAEGIFLNEDCMQLQRGYIYIEQNNIAQDSILTEDQIKLYNDFITKSISGLVTEYGLSFKQIEPEAEKIPEGKIAFNVDVLFDFDYLESSEKIKIPHVLQVGRLSLEDAIITLVRGGLFPQNLDSDPSEDEDEDEKLELNIDYMMDSLVSIKVTTMNSSMVELMNPVIIKEPLGYKWDNVSYWETILDIPTIREEIIKHANRIK